jgi:mRNA interferase RelE/StbE
MYDIKIHKTVIKFLKTRTISEQKLIHTKIDLLKSDPFKNSYLDIKKLKGIDRLYRLRIGRIRIIYQVFEDELLILIITAGTRGDVYKNL